MIKLNLYIPDTAVFTPASLKYELGEKVYKFLESKDVDIIEASANRVKSMIRGKTTGEIYTKSKKTLLVTTTQARKLAVCRPSADWQFHLVTGCPGHCEYCYLQTTHGEKPYLKMYVNLEDIFGVIESHINKSPGKIVTFEAASLGDPLSLEHISGALARTIEFFGGLENGRLRVVTKFSNTKGLLKLHHNNHTHFRVSINAKQVVDRFEHGTCGINERMEIAEALLNAGYPIGFIIAPIMFYEGWKDEYKHLLDMLAQKLGNTLQDSEITFELIQYRFTDSAKKLISQRFPKTSLDMDESKRRLKWGKYGRFKHVYMNDVARELRDYLTMLINTRFRNAKLEYFT